MLSFVVAGLACVFAALCYAEFASMVPVAGSAYTYAYATLGELFAWIIGWDLILEYAVGVGDRRPRLVALLPGRSSRIFGIAPARRRCATRPFDYDPATGALRARPAASSTCPAIVIAAVVTVDPGQGHPGERRLQRRRWSAIKLAVVLFVIVVGAFYVNPANWHPFAPYG